MKNHNEILSHVYLAAWMATFFITKDFSQAFPILIMSACFAYWGWNEV